jgi:KUP system potassium uptake protein
MTSIDNQREGTRQNQLSMLSLTALGVVFGDIGTSPLYTFKTILEMTSKVSQASTILGLLSLVIWTLIIITTVKYVSFAMRFDNHGEGGIIALMSLLGAYKQRVSIISIGLFGAALVYSDGAITPAISVLSALEGLNIVTPAFQPYILPAAVIILLMLFSIQSHGTGRIGRAFGPIMLLWFAVMALMGAKGIIQHPSVLAALHPYYAVKYLYSHGSAGFLVLGGVFLCVTGAEALYADMGHFGRRPIWTSWYAIVLPSLLLNYAGQAAWVLEGGSYEVNIFYSLCPPQLLIPLVVLATVATIIASQAIITGAFSMTRQAILLGWLPRLLIKQTSSEGYGQIYIGIINFLLMIATIALTIGFGKSSNLAAAYGIAVALTMLITSGLLFVAMRELWHWNIFLAGSVALFFIVIDSAFFFSNLSKVSAGGYIPLTMAYGVMWIWHRGATAVHARIEEALMPIPTFLENIKAKNIPRVPGTAVFMTRSTQHTPPVLRWHIKQNRALQEQVFVLCITIRPSPRVALADRFSIDEIRPNFWRTEARYGFMEHPDVPQLLKDCTLYGCKADFSDVTYYVGHETIIGREDGKGLPEWQERLFGLMQRNASHLSDLFRLPSDQVVEIGRQISI